VWSQSHYDLGEIRTESAIRPSPPEKKERLEIEENQKRLENSEAPNMCIFVVWFLINSNPDLIKEILKHEFA